MYLQQIGARHFRSFTDVEQDLHPRLNLIVGGNAAGKSTFLEAIAVLGRGRSARSISSKLVTVGQRAWRLSAAIAESGDLAPISRLSVVWSDRETRIELNDKTLSAVDLVRLLPVLLLDPASHRLIEDGPGERRRLLDWGVFHVEHSYQALWARLARVLRQRNSALRSDTSKDAIDPWTRELIAATESVNVERSKYLEALHPAVVEKAKTIWPAAKLSLRLLPGWPPERDYAEVLEADLEGDRKQGHTRHGPHRAELSILSDNQRLQAHISRGEQKLMLAVLMLAQAELHERRKRQAPVFLVDDFPAELSAESQRRLADELRRYPGQKFITALEESPVLLAMGDHAMFHVEHGHVTRKY